MATVKLRIPLRSQCLDGKRRHYSRWEAEEHLKSLRLWDKANRPTAGPLRVYRCPECDCWHVGHLRNSRR
jgi:hypothetical protein